MAVKTQLYLCNIQGI